ncbi:hypothetical protein O2N63_02015 [Aliiroseovarius sp. KMU-50]|uniref:Uncharacterized protein n=1 Tax=Aliiroseovarius salicola TaxID=3009082 RepID=A0ABT4VXA9_9RHOB|nr:hypothetical protein [Aliiroseovarius sp. KMU-50]MDA5092856.1 hypothetical protein [Aliiroseovarius sp. KMU-50]
MDRIPSGVHAQCLLHTLDRLGRENVDVIAVSRAPSGLIRSSYDQFLMAGLWEIDRQKLFDTSEARIEDFLNAFKDLWGFELKEIDKIFPLFAERYNVSRIVEIPLAADGDHVLSRIAKEVGLKSADKLPVKNAGRSTRKILMFRDFQKEHGVATFERNLRVLKQVRFPKRELSTEEAYELGLMLPKEVNTLLDKNYMAETRIHEFP